MNRSIGRWLLLGGALVLALGVAEAGVRVLGVSYPSFFTIDEVVGLKHRENVDGWFRTEGAAYVRLKTDGLRDRTYANPKPAGTFRLAILGDSFAEALQVPLEQTFGWQLEEKLKGCGFAGALQPEVLNFGVSDFGTAQELLALRETVAKYSPDLVLLAFFTGNDIRNNSKQLETQTFRPFFELQHNELVLDASFRKSAKFRSYQRLVRSTGEWASDHLRTVQLAQFVWHRYRASPATTQDSGEEAGLDAQVYTPPRTSEWRNAWSVTEALIARMQQEVRALGGRFMLVTLSNGIQVDPNPEVRRRFMAKMQIGDLFYPDRRLEQFARDRHIDAVILAPAMQREAEARQLNLHGFANTPRGRGHWNASGHAVASTLIAEHLCQSVSRGGPQ